MKTELLEIAERLQGCFDNNHYEIVKAEKGSGISGKTRFR